jgi:hypothetical protein
MRNDHKQWQQGFFVDGHQYDRWTDEEKRAANTQEKFLVRPYPKGNAICLAQSPEEANWIAQRLNLAAVLEEMTYNFATGKTDGEDIVDFVMKNMYG